MEDKILEFTLWGIHFTEPIVFLTDVVVTIGCWIYAQRIQKKHGKLAQFWVWFFWLMGFNTFIGGLSHLLFTYTGMQLKMITWVCIGLSFMLAQFGLAQQYQNTNFWKGYRVLAVLQFIVYVYLLIGHQNFGMVKVNSTLTFVPLFIYAIYVYFRSNKTADWARFIVFGVAVSSIGGLISAYKLGVNEWITYHDFGHAIMLTSFYLFHVAVMRYDFNNKPVFA